MARNVSKTILVVDDDLDILGFVVHVLQSNGYNVRQASCGQKGLEEFLHHRNEIALVLSDVVMARMNGHEVAREAIRIRPGVKVLLMSGYADEITRNQISKTGFKFIAKPFTSNGLGLKVREALES